MRPVSTRRIIVLMKIITLTEIRVLISRGITTKSKGPPLQAALVFSVCCGSRRRPQINPSRLAAVVCTDFKRQAGPIRDDASVKTMHFLRVLKFCELITRPQSCAHGALPVCNTEPECGHACSETLSLETGHCAYRETV